MASPTVEGRNESATTTASTSAVVSLPGSISSGDLLIIVIATPSINAVSDWNGFTGLAVQNGLSIGYKQADGSEGATHTVTLTISERSSHLSYRITGHADPGTQAPEVGLPGTGTSTAPNAGTVTPTGGSKDYLFITCFRQAGEEADDDTWVTGTPTNYGNLVQKTCGTAGGAASNCQCAAADRQATVSSEDAAAFTTAQSLAWTARTIAIHPAAAATPGPGSLRRRHTTTRDYDPFSVTGWL